MPDAPTGPNGREYPMLDRAPATGLYATLTCPEGKEIHVADGDSVVFDPADEHGERMTQRRVRFRVVTDTSIATVECDPVTLVVGLIAFCNPERADRVIAAVGDAFENPAPAEPEGDRIDA